LSNLRPNSERGFTLIEIVVAMGVVAILAGTLVPLAFRELIRAREDATRSELDAIASGLMDFYEDTGRFPTEDEGLLALVDDPGLSTWQGPYLGGGRGVAAEEVVHDQFGEAYAYDFDPKVRPRTEADVLVASGGSDYSFAAGEVGRTWRLEEAEDDLLVLVTAGPVVRDKTRDCRRELERLAEASREFFEQNAAFPSSSEDLSGSYMDAGIERDAFLDPWNSAYRFRSSSPAASPPLLTLLSFGPDRQDDEGGGDDLALLVSSEPPGRRSTLRELEIAQTVLNESPSVPLAGRWRRDRESLGLQEAFLQDGWGRIYGINRNSRTVFSAGPDGNEISTADNIPKEVGP